MSGEWVLVGMLALEAAMVIAAAALLARRVTSGSWQRTIWQACFVGLLAIVLVEGAGGTRVIDWIRPKATPTTRSLAEPIRATGDRIQAPALMPSENPAGNVATVPTPAPAPVRHVSGQIPPQVAPIHQNPDRAGVGVLKIFAVLWMGGSLIVLFLNALARARFAVLQRRGRALTQPALVDRVREIAALLGRGRQIRLFESARLIGPVACGILRPAIGLPPRFDEETHPAERDAILAHEIAHLVAADPVWYLVADVVSAVLWWHPLVWWARGQLHAASETGADEASLLLLDGPGVLAESLVALGTRLDRPRPAAWLGIEGTGFRSGLARRVERLLRLSGRRWSPPGRAGAAVARTLVPAVVVTALILCTAWTVPEPQTPGEKMKHPQWNRSIGLVSVMMALVAPGTSSSAADAVKTNLARARAADPAMVSAPKSMTRPRTAADLQAKLESIVLDEVAYDGLPLSEVIRSLMRDAEARDPERVGVNFLFGKPAEPIRSVATIDPSTGLPLPSVGEESDLNATTIRIVPPLKKVRLIDALDAIVRVSDRPIQYTVEGYAVVLTYDGVRINSLKNGLPVAPPPAPLQTRAFKIETNSFFASLHTMFRVTLDPVSLDVGELLQKHIFPKLGVVLASDRLVFYNPLTSMLLVRGSAEEISAVQAAIDVLTGNVGSAAESAGGARAGTGSAKNNISR